MTTLVNQQLLDRSGRFCDRNGDASADQDSRNGRNESSTRLSSWQKMRRFVATDAIGRDFRRAGCLLLSASVTELNSLHEDLTEQIIACAITVHNTLGPGLLESIYQQCLAVELRAASLHVETGRSVPVWYRGSVVGPRLKVDLVVAELVVVEVKAVHSFAPVHHAQVISYLKLTGCPIGLLLNFNVTLLKHGIRKVVRPDLYKKKSPVSPVAPV